MKADWMIEEMRAMAFWENLNPHAVSLFQEDD